MNHVLPCYPTVHEHRTTRITPSQARRKLDRYLRASLTCAQHHPDAVLTPGGVTFSAASGPRGSLTMTNLRRVERGLDGEDLAPTEEDMAALKEARYRRGGGGGAAGDRVWSGRGLEGIGNSRDRGVVRPSALKKGASFDADEDEERRRRDELNAGDDGAGEGWMDMQDYERSREALEGEVGDRDGAAVVKQGQNTFAPEVATFADGEDGGAGTKRKPTAHEKELRRANKKERVKAAQRQKEQKKLGQ